MKCLSVRLGLLSWGLVGFCLAAVNSSATGWRYSAATPHTPVVNKYKYIPLHYGLESEDSRFTPAEEAEEMETGTSSLAPSQLIMTVFQTALDVVRGINAKRKAATKLVTSENATTLTTQRKNDTKVEAGRGFEDYYDEHHEHHYHETTTTTTPKPPKQSRYTDPWAGYYDFIINEGSFKFWSVFQLFTVAVLLYACLSAIYYAKFNPIIPDYDREYDDYFLERTVGRSTRSIESWELPSGLSWITPRTFQFILDALAKNYETES